MSPLALETRVANLETNTALLKQSDERRADDITEIKAAVGGIQRSINKGLIAVSGLLFTTVINLLIALNKLGGKA